MFSTQKQSLTFPPPHTLAATITPVTPKTPAARTRSQKSRFRLHSPLKQHRLSNGNKGFLQPAITLNLDPNLNPNSQATSTAPPSAFKVPASTFTFSVTPHTNNNTNIKTNSKNNATSTVPAMPPKLSSRTRPQLVKKGASKSGSGSTKAGSSKSQANASANGSSSSKLTLDHMFAAQSNNKRALSPTATSGNEVTPSKRFKNEAGDALPLLFSLPQAASSEESLVPPSSLNTSTSAMSYTTETSTVSTGTETSSYGQETVYEPSLPAVTSLREPPSSVLHSMESTEASEDMEDMESTDSSKMVPDVPGLTTPVHKSTHFTLNSVQAELAQTPKAPWLTPGSKTPTFKLSPVRQAVRTLKPIVGLSKTPVRIPKNLKFPTGNKDIPAVLDAGPSTSAGDPFATDPYETEDHAESSNAMKDTEIPSARTSGANTASSSSAKPRSLIPTLTPHAKRDKMMNPNKNVSAAFALPTSLSPTKTPGRTLFTYKTHTKSSPVKPKLSVKPSILKRAGTASSLLGGTASGSDTDMASLKSPNGISSTLAALMNRTTVDPHAATQAQLNTLNQALEELDMPRPPSSMGQRPPVPRPSTSLGVHEASKKGLSGASGKTLANGTSKLPPARPGTALGVNSSAGRAMMGKAGASSVAQPPVSSIKALNAASSVEARRASTATLSLSQSVPLGVGPRAAKGKMKPPVPAYTTASGRRVVSSVARGVQPQSSAKGKEVDKSLVLNTVSDSPRSSDAAGGDAGSSAGASADTAIKAPAPAAPVPLDILKDCVIYVDVKTEDGEDAGSLFVDMLRGLGAKILSRPGGSLTHIVYKSGLHSTLVKYRSLPEPKPAVVGIGWVVECVEKREKADTARYAISLEEEAGSVLEGLKPTKPGKSQQPANTSKSVQTKLSFKPSTKDKES